MGKRGSMPTRKRIFEYWNGKLDGAVDDNTCFKCGFTLNGSTAVERAHIISFYRSSNNDVSNLHLLCVNCHRQSEYYEGECYEFWFNNWTEGVVSDYLFKLKLAANIYFGRIKEPYDWGELRNIVEEAFVKNGTTKEQGEEYLKKYLNYGV